MPPTEHFNSLVVLSPALSQIKSNMQTNLIIREFLNGGLFPLSVILAAIICIFLLDVRAVRGRNWRQADGVEVSCALGWLFTAEAIRAGCAWLILHTQNRGGDPAQADLLFNVLFIISGVALFAAFIRCIYLFTPTEWRRWIVYACVGYSALFLSASWYF